MANKHSKTVVVIGGGAAGFFCAINVAQDSRIKVILLEKTTKFLSKVRVSGGGRCNVTNAWEHTPSFSDNYPRGSKFLRKAFSEFNNKDTVQWFKNHGVNLKTEPDGRMFPSSNTSETIVDCLMDEAVKLDVELRTKTYAEAITPKDHQYIIALNNGGEILADFVVIATGGYPKREMYDWVQDNLTQQAIAAPIPSLFTFNLPKNPICELMGLSVPNAVVKILGTKILEQGPLLVTHWGLSGPVILRSSAWGASILHDKQWNFDIVVNWIPEYNEEAMSLYLLQEQSQNATRKIVNKNPFQLPTRLWSYFLSIAEIEEEETWANLKAKQRNKLAKTLCNQQFEVRGKTTFKEEFVTAGGFELKNIDVKTMQSKLYPNVFVVGEALNIDGITGGFNFQNAWTTSFIAAKSMLKQLDEQ